MIRPAVAALLAAAFFAAPLAAEDAPWGFTQASVSEPAAAVSLSYDLFQALVQGYRDNKESTSIHRCLFDVSCSHFAEKAFSQYGFLLGGVLFIDRYFYRENNGARGLYPLRGDEHGVFHLDDGPFLP